MRAISAVSLCRFQPLPVTFSLDLDAIEKALTERTRVLLINSPNNPAGVIYSQEELVALV